MSPRPLTLDELRAIDLFTELDDEQLEAWRTAAEVHELAVGDQVAADQVVVPAVTFLLEGTAEALAVLPDGRTEPTWDHVAPTWVGALSALTDAPLNVRMVARTPCRAAVVAQADFVDLAFTHRPVLLRVMQRAMPVANRVASRSQNRERLESLGTMAAGLAHEMNNPAAAARRAASDLATALETLSSTLTVFVEAGVEREQAHRLAELHADAVARAAARTALSALDAADAEDELTDLLDDLDVPDGWKLAEPLAAAGLDEAWVRDVVAAAGPAAGAALGWVAATLTARGLADELRESTARMSGLVTSVKKYAYMDRGEVVEVDVHEGLETTLVVLGHKLKHTEISVVRAYDRDLPQMTVHGSELNQVWTNLLDNAIDALEERGGPGTITITSRQDGDCAELLIADDGPGIPEAVVGRVFDPFYTSKAVGKGTGIGLDTARRIVEDRHRGSLTVRSQPGRTVFTVRLPLHQG